MVYKYRVIALIALVASKSAFGMGFSHLAAALVAKKAPLARSKHDLRLATSDYDWEIAPKMTHVDWEYQPSVKLKPVWSPKVTTPPSKTMTYIDSKDWTAADCRFAAGVKTEWFGTHSLYEIQKGEFKKILLRVNGQNVGFVFFLKSDKRPNAYYVSRLYIDGPYRQKGYASCLMGKLIHESFANQKIENIVLYCEPDNYKARALYEKLGFREDDDCACRYIIDRNDYLSSAGLQNK